MAVSKQLFAALLTLVFATSAFAEHKHHSGHKNQHKHADKHRSAHHQVTGKHLGHRAEQRYYDAHREPAVHQSQQHRQSYQRYPGRTVYRSVKRHSAHRDERRYDHGYEHRRSYSNERRDTYRLIAGAIVLNEVLHHIHH
ncbi:MAG: hypothetical protein KBT88_03625 [Gammaproteobacteria bacterium]|nr:hypothetical protein [Gammaproteobacteria bacterium]MBQ0838851.1 hypothetical protein [Gammaproteobacteria bacterium]